MKQAFLHKLCYALTVASFAGFRVLIRAEKAVFFRTGIKGRALRWFWEEKGRRLQKALNREHGTAYKYGYISSK
ncbi:MAG: hypothetical protein IJ714_01780 [Bacteroidales bacterium]|nr:hypothetical protein [Bacteroidales bacterium]